MAAAAEQKQKKWRGRFRKTLRLTLAALPVVLLVLPGTLPGQGSLRPRLESEPDEQASGTDEYDIDRYPNALDTLSNDEADDEEGQIVRAANGPSDRSDAPVVGGLTSSGIPEIALSAYRRAEQTLAVSDPSCGIRWSLLAAIGRVESNHGRFGGAQLRADGYGTRPIRGIPLDGRPGVATIRDTDRGALDSDAIYDRAVGPMQFIPSTWRSVAADGNGDGLKDPDNIFDAAVGAATYLCAGDGDLRVQSDRAAAVRRYNNSTEYVSLVLALADAYERGQAAGTLPSPGPAAPVPPALPTPPRGPVNVGTPPAFPRGGGATTRPPASAPTTSGPGSTWLPTSTSTSSSTTSSSTTSSSTSSSSTSSSTTTTLLPCPTTTTTTSTSTTSSTTTTTLLPTTTTTVPPGCPTTTTTSTTLLPTTLALPTTTLTLPPITLPSSSSSSSAP